MWILSYWRMDFMECEQNKSVWGFCFFINTNKSRLSTLKPLLTQLSLFPIKNQPCDSSRMCRWNFICLQRKIKSCFVWRSSELVDVHLLTRMKLNQIQVFISALRSWFYIGAALRVRHPIIVASKPSLISRCRENHITCNNTVNLVFVLPVPAQIERHEVFFRELR